MLRGRAGSKRHGQGEKVPPISRPLVAKARLRRHRKNRIFQPIFEPLFRKHEKAPRSRAGPLGQSARPPRPRSRSKAPAAGRRAALWRRRLHGSAGRIMPPLQGRPAQHVAKKGGIEVRVATRTTRTRWPPRQSSVLQASAGRAGGGCQREPDEQSLPSLVRREPAARRRGVTTTSRRARIEAFAWAPEGTSGRQARSFFPTAATRPASTVPRLAIGLVPEGPMNLLQFRCPPCQTEGPPSGYEEGGNRSLGAHGTDAEPRGEHGPSRGPARQGTSRGGCRRGPGEAKAYPRWTRPPGRPPARRTTSASVPRIEGLAGAPKTSGRQAAYLPFPLRDALLSTVLGWPSASFPEGLESMQSEGLPARRRVAGADTVSTGTKASKAYPRWTRHRPPARAREDHQRSVPRI